MRRYEKIFRNRAALNAQLGPWPFAGRYPTRICFELVDEPSDRLRKTAFSKPSPEAWTEAIKTLNTAGDRSILRVSEFDRRASVRVVSFNKRREILASAMSNVVSYYYLAEKDWLRNLSLIQMSLFRPLRLKEGSIYFCPKFGIPREKLFALARCHLRGFFLFRHSDVENSFFNPRLQQALRDLVNEEAPPRVNVRGRDHAPIPHRNALDARTTRLVQLFNNIRRRDA